MIQEDFFFQISNTDLPDVTPYQTNNSSPALNRRIPTNQFGETCNPENKYSALVPEAPQSIPPEMTKKSPLFLFFIHNPSLTTLTIMNLINWFFQRC